MSDTTRKAPYVSAAVIWLTQRGKPSDSAVREAIKCLKLELARRGVGRPRITLAAGARVTTGYYANQTTLRATKVHIAVDGAPACRAKTTGVFHWCAHGVQRNYLTCEHCKDWDDRRIAQEYGK